jgi:hypothetical protein
MGAGLGLVVGITASIVVCGPIALFIEMRTGLRRSRILIERILKVLTDIDKQQVETSYDNQLTSGSSSMKDPNEPSIMNIEYPGEHPMRLGITIVIVSVVSFVFLWLFLIPF